MGDEQEMHVIQNLIPQAARIKENAIRAIELRGCVEAAVENSNIGIDAATDGKAQIEEAFSMLVQELCKKNSTRIAEFETFCRTLYTEQTNSQK